jgi:hypothetical protein
MCELSLYLWFFFKEKKIQTIYQISCLYFDLWLPI